MKNRITLALTVAAVAAVALTGCAASQGAGSAPTVPHSEKPVGRTALRTSSSSLGTIITASDGDSVYLFTDDRQNSGKSTCYGACAAAWPPVTTTASMPSGAGVSGRVGTITRTDGTKQVTVDGWPVYRFAQDAEPGDVNGQGLMQAWFVIDPSGSAITTSASGSVASTAPSSSGSSWG